jgi:hypothetical protein
VTSFSTADIDIVEEDNVEEDTISSLNEIGIDCVILSSSIDADDNIPWDIEGKSTSTLIDGEGLIVIDDTAL